MDCHQFPLPQSIQKSALRRKEIGWLPLAVLFFSFPSDLRHGPLGLLTLVSLPRSPLSHVQRGYSAAMNSS